MKWNKIPSLEKKAPWLEYYPEGVDRQLDYPEMPLDEVVKRNAKEMPDRAAIYFEGAKTTFKELDEQVDKFASALVKLGIKKGDVVLLDMPNIPQYVIAFYGTLRANAIPNPIIPLNRFAEITHQANDSKAKALVVLDHLYDEYFHGNDLSKLETLEFVIMTGIAEALSPIKAKIGTLIGKVPRMKVWPEKEGKIVFHPFQDVLAMGEPVSLPDRSELNVHEDAAALIYTGGTTGSPKGCVLTHFNLLANGHQAYQFSLQLPKLKDYGRKGKPGGIVLVLPMSHSFGLGVGMSIGFYMGYHLILLPKPPEPLSNLLKAAKKHNGVFCPGVPTIWNKITQEKQSSKYKGKLPDFQACLSGAAPLAFDVKKKFEELTGALITEGYGMSEASPLLTANPFMRPRPNTVGLPVSDTYLKIVDVDSGKEKPPCTHTEPYCSENCGPDEAEKFIGEICGSGPQVMKGYLGRPDETKHALRTDNEGVTWYHTADIGCIDCEGYCHIKDRLRDMIKYKGHAVFPREVEDLMYQHEAINEVGVYGVPSGDPDTGEIIKATISLKEGYESTTVDEIIEWCKKNIAGYKYPREIEIVDELPKSLIGKVLRRVLRDQEEEKAEQ